MWLELNYRIQLLEVYVIYIPPEGSVYGGNTEETYDELLLQTYVTSKWDNFVIMGDFNARVGDLKDSLDIDSLHDRQTIDHTVNGQGKDLINFLIESKCCMVNGRLGDGNDYTLENNRGRSVVDYLIIEMRSQVK